MRDQMDDQISELQGESTGKAVMPIKDFGKFYQFYLTEHQNPTSRKLHFVGSTFGLLGLATAVKKRKVRYALMGITAGYACAWVGHFVFEKNKPASFKQPLYSFISDFRMYSDILRGRISLKGQAFDKI